MRRCSILLLVSIVLPVSAMAQATFVDSCATPDWFASCTQLNACGPGMNGCVNNWFAGFGCGGQCPLPFPGQNAAVTIPPGAIATLNGGAADIFSIDAQRLFSLSGTFTLRGDSIFRNGLNWTGGGFVATSPAVEVLIPAGSPLAIFDNNGKTISAAQLVLDQAATWEGLGPIFVSNGGAIVNNAFFVARNDQGLSFGGGLPVVFQNNGTFRKLNSTGITTISNIPFINDGVIEVLSGTLRMSNAGTSYGPITLSPNTALDFAFGNYNFDVGTVVTGVGVLRANGTLNLLSNIDIDNVELTQRISGPGDLRVVHAMTWISGDMFGGGKTTIPQFASLSLTSANGKSLNERDLINVGDLTIGDNGPLFLANGSDLINSGTVDVAGDSSINFAGGAVGVFENSGTFTKSTGAGIAIISNLPFNSPGSIEVHSGTLRLSTTGTTSGPVVLDPNTVLDFAFGNYNFAAGASIAGDGLARLNGTTSLLDDLAIDRAELTQILAGPGDLTVVKDMQWISGAMSGGGTTHIPPAATLRLTTNNGKSLSSRNLDNSGLARLSDGPFFVGSGATVDNLGMFEIGGDADVSFSGGAPSVFNNAGTIRKTTGTDLTVFSNLPLNNTGLVEVKSGTLRMSNAGTSSGPFILDPNTVLDFAFGNYSFATGSSVTGDGVTRLNGTTTLLDDVTFERVELTQSLLGPGDLTVSRDMNWSSGTMSGGGTTTIPALATLALTTGNGKSLSNRSLHTSGFAALSDGPLFLANGSVVDNLGTFEIAGDADVSFGGGAASAFNNVGTLRKISGADLTVFSNVPLNNAGLVEVKSGTLRMSNGGTSSGAIVLDPNTVLDFAFGNYNFAAGASVAGDGVARFNGTTNLLAQVVIDRSELTNDLRGPGDLMVGASMSWTSGTMRSGGTTIVPVGATFDISTVNGKSLDARSLINNGLLVWRDNGSIALSNAATIQNAGLVEIRGSSGLSFGGGSPVSISNTGTIRKLASAGATQISSVPVSNAGEIDIQTGTLGFSNLTQTAGVTRIAAGAVLQLGQPFALQGGVLTGHGSVVGNVSNVGGRVQPGGSPGVLTINGGYAQVVGGALDIELAGAAPGAGHDQLAVAGTATLAGELQVSFTNGFVPAPGQQFVILTAGMVTGAFSSVSVPGQYELTYTPTSVVLSVFSTTCLGDVNCDGAVDFFDIDPFVAKIGCPGTGPSCDAGCPWRNADTDQDGDVDFFDIDPFVSRLGSTCR